MRSIDGYILYNMSVSTSIGCDDVSIEERPKSTDGEIDSEIKEVEETVNCRLEN